MQWVYISHFVFILIIMFQFIFPEPEIRELTIILVSAAGILLSLMYCFSIFKDENITKSNLKNNNNMNKFQDLHKAMFMFLFILYTIFLSGSIFTSILNTKELHIHNPGYPEFSFRENYTLPGYSEADIINERSVNIR